MTKITFLLAACGLAFATPVVAQSSSYTMGTVWQVSSIKVMPGQFENYMDFLAGNWRKEFEFGKKQGYVVSYHVFAVNNAREGEPDLMLAVEYKDYIPIAQQMEYQKQFEAMMAADAHKMETESGTRVTMRKEAGSIELQELKFK